MKLSPQLIDTDSGPAEVFVAGEGQALVVLHGRGFGSGWRSYAWLGEEFPDHRVITVSRPGYGETPVRTAPTFEEQGRLVLSIADTLEIDRVVVLGVSNGGPAALWAATESPDRIAGLVLWCAMAAPLVNEESAEEMEAELVDDVLRESYEGEMAVYSAAVKAAEIDEETALALMTRTELDRLRRDPTIERSIRNYVESRLASPPGIDGVRNDAIQTQADRTKSHQLFPQN